MMVLDASVTVDYLLALPPHAPAIAAHIASQAPDLAAPHLLDVEVAQVIRRWVLAGKLTAARGRAALVDLADMPLVRYEHGPLLDRAFDLHANATVYDAVYLALAEALDVPLLTRDEALALVPKHRARVIVVS